MRNYDFSKFTNGPASAFATRLHRKNKLWSVMAYDRTGTLYRVYSSEDENDAKEAMTEIQRIVNAAHVMDGTEKVFR